MANAGPFAIAIARMSGCDACAEMLLKASPPPFVSIVAGILAPPLGNGRQTRVFIERGADVNARDPEGRPLIVAVAGSDSLPVDTMQALLQRGAALASACPPTPDRIKRHRGHGRIFARSTDLRAAHAAGAL